MCDKKIKIMHIAECVGGVKRYLNSLLKYMNKDKFENILVLSQLYKISDFSHFTPNVEIINIPHNLITPKLIISIKNIRDLIIKYNPDIIYAHSSVAGGITRIACIGLKNKVIYNPHGWAFNMQSSKSGIYVILERFLSKFCDKIVCISDAEKISGIKNKISKSDKFKVIYNGIDINEYKPQNLKKSDLDIPNDKIIIGMVGRICKQKAPDIFIRMANEVSKQIADCYYIIVCDVLESDLKEKEEVLKLAQKYNIELRITGWIDNPLDYISLFDVACLFSRWEGFGLAIPEYMICKKPIVATNIDAIPYLIENGRNGFLIEKDDYINASRKVIEIIQNEDLKNIFIKNNINDVCKKFDAKRFAEEHENLFKEILK